MGLDGSNGSEELEDTLVAALVQLHGKGARQTSRGSNQQSEYDRVLRHFDRRGQRMRGEAVLTRQFVDGLLAGTRRLPRAPLQQEIAIGGPAGDVAAGRFRVSNRTERPSSVSFVIGEPMTPVPCRPEIRMEPLRALLEPGESRLVRVEVDLSGWREGDTSTIPVEARADAGRDRLWIVVTALQRRTGAP